MLDNKRCLLVGATSGIGLAAAERFLDHGARLVIAGLDDEDGRRAEQDLVAQGEVHFVACDATKPDSVASLFDQAQHHLGEIDVLYHLAGGSGRRLGDGPLHECSDEGWRATLDLNLTSTFLTNRAAVRHFLEEGRGGVILNMASVLALSPAPDHFETIGYTAAKGGVLALSRLAAARYARDGIRVNVIAPGLVETPMAARAVSDPAIRQYLSAKQPTSQGPLQAKDLAEASVFLCSDAASQITGVVLPVDGGWCVSEGGGVYTEDNAS